MLNISEELGLDTFGYPQAIMLDFVCEGKDDVSDWSENKGLVHRQKACRDRFDIHESWEYEGGDLDHLPAGRM